MKFQVNTMAQCCSECKKKDIIINKGYAAILGLREEIEYQAEETQKILCRMETIERKLIQMDAMNAQLSQYILKEIEVMPHLYF